MAYRRNQSNGFMHLVTPLIGGLVILAVIGTVFFINQKQSMPKATASPQSLQALASYKDLKAKLADYVQKGASTAGVANEIALVYALINQQKLDQAATLTASLSAQLDKSLAEKLEVDRLASEAAKKAADEAAIRKAEEEAKRKALEEAAKKKKAEEATKPTAQPQTPASAPQPVAQTAAPAGGYSRFLIGTLRGNYTIDLIKMDVGGLQVITDSGSTADCSDNCGALSLADYINRHGGFAGMNGTYFCPPDYAFCAGKVNTFSWFVFNAGARTFLNADKRDWGNAGSLFVFRPGSIQFFRSPAGFGLDTSITGAIASFPTLMADGQIVLDDSVMDDKQRTAKGNRSGICNTGNTLMMVIARSATVPDLAAVMQSLGCSNAINLDGGGSNAMYYGGYKVGPGRALPNAIILKR